MGFKISQIRRKLLYDVEGSPDKQKALGFLLCLRHRLQAQSAVPMYSRNKIHKLTGSSDGTVKKYIDILKSMGLIYFQTESGGSPTLRFVRLSSGTKHRNIRCDNLSYKDPKTAYESVRHLMHIMRIANKHFIKQAIRVRNNPRTLVSKMKREDFKKARTLCKNYARQNADGSYSFNDWGISYKTIAEHWGCCEKTAFNYIKKGLQKHRFKKERHFEWNPFPYMSAYEISQMGNYTFCVDGWGVKVGANTYTNTASWEKRTDNKDALLIDLTLGEYQHYMQVKAEKKAQWLERKRACEGAWRGGRAAQISL